MKQFQYVRPNGYTRGPFTAKDVTARLFGSSRVQVLALSEGETCIGSNGDEWTRLPDLVLQDDVPLTAEDVTECRESALRVRQSVRLERIATAVLQGLCANSYDGHGNAPQYLAIDAIAIAKALIAELDKQS